MERGSIRAVLMLGLVLGLMVVGESTVTSFKDCYVKCFIFCFITPNTTACSCSLQCLKDCIIPSDSDHPLQTHNTATHTTNFCKLGCASSLCSNLSTKNNPAGEKVESCVNSCSNKCTDYHNPSPNSKTRQFGSAKP